MDLAGRNPAADVAVFVASSASSPPQVTLTVVVIAIFLVGKKSMQHHHRSKHRVVLANGGHRCRCRPGERGGRGRREAGLRLAPAPPPPPRRGAPAARPPWRWRPARPAASPVPAASTSPPAAALLHPHLRLGHNVAAKDAEALLPTHSSLLSAAARLVPHRLEPRACSCARGDDEHRGGLHRRRDHAVGPPPPSPGCIGEEDHGLLVKSATAAGGIFVGTSTIPSPENSSSVFTKIVQSKQTKYVRVFNIGTDHRLLRSLVNPGEEVILTVLNEQLEHVAWFLPATRITRIMTNDDVLVRSLGNVYFLVPTMWACERPKRARVDPSARMGATANPHTGAAFSVRSGGDSIGGRGLFLLQFSTPWQVIISETRSSGFKIDWDEKSKTGTILTSALLFCKQSPSLNDWRSANQYASDAEEGGSVWRTSQELF
ncbi:hypothetical protein OsJ_17104 [Oryza sativa Japonica Group]|uniref:Uncharacterized protein n=1 Tax=Oryza sativa subsp. japonica TaxID=39947 RepID=B9FME9_ORYSJ|nr:hypothetical protein OsJ_17104 [Oryza sativa Japonica Group]